MDKSENNKQLILQIFHLIILMKIVTTSFLINELSWSISSLKYGICSYLFFIWFTFGNTLRRAFHMFGSVGCAPYIFAKVSCFRPKLIHLHDLIISLSCTKDEIVVFRWVNDMYHFGYMFLIQSFFFSHLMKIIIWYVVWILARQRYKFKYFC